MSTSSPSEILTPDRTSPYQLPEPTFNKLELFGLGFVGFIISALVFGLSYIPLVLLISPLIVVLTNGEVYLDRFSSIEWAACCALVFAMFVSGAGFGTERVRKSWLTHLFVPLMIWTSILLISTYYGISTILGTLGLIVALAASTAAGGEFARRCLSSSQPTDLTPRSNLYHMWMLFKTTALQLVATIIVFAGAFVAFEKLSDRATEILFVGRPAPKAQFNTAAGASWSLEDQRGKVLILVLSGNLRFAQTSQKYSELAHICKKRSHRNDLEMVVVSLPELRKTNMIRSIDEALQLYEPNDPLNRSRLCFNDIVPSIYLFDREGTIVMAKRVGVFYDTKMKEWDDEVERLLGSVE